MENESLENNHYATKESLYVNGHLDPEAIILYADDQLSDSFADEVELHTVDCRKCRESVRLAFQISVELNSISSSVTHGICKRVMADWEFIKLVWEGIEPDNLLAAAKAKFAGNKGSWIDGLPGIGSRGFFHPPIELGMSGTDIPSNVMSVIVSNKEPDILSIMSNGYPDIRISIDPNKGEVAVEFQGAVLVEYRGEDIGAFGPVVALVPEDPDREK